MATTPESSFQDLSLFLSSETEAGHEFDNWDKLIDFIADYSRESNAIELPNVSLTHDDLFSIIGYFIRNNTIGTLVHRMIKFKETREIQNDKSPYQLIRSKILSYTAKNGNDILTLAEIFKELNNPSKDIIELL
jgi:hypothetical protein